MVEVRPLNAIVYNREKVKMKDVIAPPYDVISDEYRDELYKRSDYNVVKLILAKGAEDLNTPHNRYENAAETYHSWLNQGVLVKCEKPCIFYIVQKYINEHGKEIQRKGFIAKNRIENFESGKILPHEYTMGGPKQDRFNLTQKCNANFSQIFMVYSDPQKQIEAAVDLSVLPFIDVEDDLGVQNTVWKIEDEATIELIQNVMSDKTLLIADGHHRYETAMAYRDYRNSEGESEGEWAFVMSYFTNLDDENLVVYPTHRIITKFIEPFVLLEKIKKYFDIEDWSFTSELKETTKEKFLEYIEVLNTTQIAFGLYMKNVNKFYILKLRETALVDNILDSLHIGVELRGLDLVVLHKILLEQEFGFTQEELMAQKGIKYVKQEAEAFGLVDSGKAEASFILGYPKMQQIKEISQAGFRMPQKSTYFYPKLLSGIVINPL